MLGGGGGGSVLIGQLVYVSFNMGYSVPGVYIVVMVRSRWIRVVWETAFIASSRHN